MIQKPEPFAWNNPPTPYPDVNAILREVLVKAQDVLGDQFTGMYLDGSLTSGDFDEASDIDFVVVTEDEIPNETFLALQAMHDRLAQTNSIWAIQLEGSYISRRALRRADPAFSMYPNIERGRGERLKLAYHGDVWDIHRSVLRERGITLAGPDPLTLIDPVSPAKLRQAMRSILDGWGVKIIGDPSLIQSRGYQSYVALTMCRILYTLENGAVVSKRSAARWAQEKLDEKWGPLIERAWANRHGPDSQATPEDVNATVELVRFTVDR